MSAIEVITIILSVVALIVTIIGFFASLKFYRDGVEMQTLSNETLVKIQEKADSIHGQVGGMLDKTLDAVISRNELSNNFEEIYEQLENATQTIIDTALHEIDIAGEEEKGRFSSVVDEQIAKIRRLVDETHESAKTISEATLIEPAIAPAPSSRIGHTMNRIATILMESQDDISETELIKQLRKELPPYLVRRALYALQYDGFITSYRKQGNRMYRFKS